MNAQAGITARIPKHLFYNEERLGQIFLGNDHVKDLLRSIPKFTTSKRKNQVKSRQINCESIEIKLFWSCSLI